MAEITTWCASCGPDVAIDEDGCCATCGCDAIGEGAEQAGLFRAELSSERTRREKAEAELAKVDLELDKARVSRIITLRGGTSADDQIVGAWNRIVWLKERAEAAEKRLRTLVAAFEGDPDALEAVKSATADPALYERVVKP